MRRRSGLGPLLGATVGLILSLPAPDALAADCTLVSVAKGKADLVVYFTKFREEDKTAGKYKACKLVSKKRPGSKSFRVTPFRQDATVVVHRSNWP